MRLHVFASALLLLSTFAFAEESPITKAQFDVWIYCKIEARSEHLERQAYRYVKNASMACSLSEFDPGFKYSDIRGSIIREQYHLRAYHQLLMLAKYSGWKLGWLERTVEKYDKMLSELNAAKKQLAVRL